MKKSHEEIWYCGKTNGYFIHLEFTDVVCDLGPYKSHEEAQNVVRRTKELIRK